MPDYQYYPDGKWTPIKDPLNGEHPGRYGFDTVDYTKSLQCFGLPLSVYARAAETLPLPFNFYCQLSVRPLEFRIWVTDLPELLSLLRDLQASQLIPGLDMLVSHADSALTGFGSLHVSQ